MGEPDKDKDKGKDKKSPQQINREFAMSLTALQDSLASLMVVVKYMQYDLEQTKLENVDLKRELKKYKPEE